MDARLIERVESSIEIAAAAVFGGAITYAASRWLVGSAQGGWGYLAAAGMLAFLLCLGAMRLIGRREPHFSVPAFDVRDLELEFDELLLIDSDRVGSVELVLTDNDRITPLPAEPLELDDVLTAIDPDARVVRLFDPKSMPAAEQARIKRGPHRQGASPITAASDASQALSEALAQLRRSLR